MVEYKRGGWRKEGVWDGEDGRAEVEVEVEMEMDGVGRRGWRGMAIVLAVTTQPALARGGPLFPGR